MSFSWFFICHALWLWAVCMRTRVNWALCKQHATSTPSSWSSTPPPSSSATTANMLRNISYCLDKWYLIIHNAFIIIYICYAEWRYAHRWAWKKITLMCLCLKQYRYLLLLPKWLLTSFSIVHGKKWMPSRVCVLSHLQARMKLWLWWQPQLNECAMQFCHTIDQSSFRMLFFSLSLSIIVRYLNFI